MFAGMDSGFALRLGDLGRFLGGREMDRERVDEQAHQDLGRRRRSRGVHTRPLESAGTPCLPEGVYVTLLPNSGSNITKAGYLYEVYFTLPDLQKAPVSKGALAFSSWGGSP